MSLWEYRNVTDASDVNIDGFDVEALDGSIGKIDEASASTGSSYIVVDTGFWIFGKKRLIPAAAITSIDVNEARVFVSLTKDQVKSAPDMDSSTDRTGDDWHQRHVGQYYDRYEW
jgi:hypothetical protein